MLWEWASGLLFRWWDIEAMECWQQRAGSTVPGPKPGRSKFIKTPFTIINLKRTRTQGGCFCFFYILISIVFSEVYLSGFCPRSAPSSRWLEGQDQSLSAIYSGRLQWWHSQDVWCEQGGDGPQDASTCCLCLCH